MKKYFFLIFLVLCSSALSYSQMNDNYKFIIERKNFIDSAKGFYANKQYEFQFNRVFLDKSTFVDSGIFGNDENPTDTFRIINDLWYVSFNGEFKPVFRVNKKTKIKISGLVYELNFNKREFINGIECNVFHTFPSGSVSGSNFYYWFNSERGIIKIKTGGICLIRSDIL